MVGRVSLLFAACLWVASPGEGVPAQEAAEVTLPANKLTCLVENQQKYLNLRRALVIFVADLCPAISRWEVAEYLAKNSAEGKPDDAQRLAMLKSEFRCLVEKIEAFIAASEGYVTQETVVFRLDCS